MARPSRKENVAKEQLEDGIVLFLEKRYVSSLTLLGAAAEIFEGLIHSKEGIEPFNHEWTRANKVRSILGIKHISKGEIRKIYNEAKNQVKHHDLGDDESIQLDRFGEAFMMIQRATSGANRLNIKYKNKLKYEKWFKNITNT
ncbi:hypothetical protein [Zhongshania sp. BJYM1]|uniref:hypothetical protein n=1 Tax=Zhongshania aquatica TaxID=2965069 RepID=UPI0022B43C81|nr:hypothetical protein [Marortus sp. BJYM1]